MTVVESVYCAARTDSLYAADYVSSLNGKCQIQHIFNHIDLLRFTPTQYLYNYQHNNQYFIIHPDQQEFVTNTTFLQKKKITIYTTFNILNFMYSLM
jgi:hypothetical protein